MKKLFFLFTMMLAGIVACSACTKKNQVAPQDPVVECDGGSCPMAPLPGDVIAEDNWRFILPSDGWAKKASPDPDIKIVLINPNDKRMVLFLKSAGATDKYATTALRAMMSTGLIVSQTTPVMINGLQFLEAQVNRPGTPNITAWMWLASKNGFGYGFMCGGSSATVGDIQDHHDFCKGIASTIQIK
jgi:hypothetical protein